jgi:hypothetical protein
VTDGKILQKYSMPLVNDGFDAQPGKTAVNQWKLAGVDVSVYGLVGFPLLPNRVAALTGPDNGKILGGQNGTTYIEQRAMGAVAHEARPLHTFLWGRHQPWIWSHINWKVQRQGPAQFDYNVSMKKGQAFSSMLGFELDKDLNKYMPDRREFGINGADYQTRPEDFSKLSKWVVDP